MVSLRRLFTNPFDPNDPETEALLRRIIKDPPISPELATGTPPYVAPQVSQPIVPSEAIRRRTVTPSVEATGNVVAPELPVIARPVGGGPLLTDPMGVNPVARPTPPYVEPQPVAPMIVRATNAPYDLGGGSTYSGTYTTTDENGLPETNAQDLTRRPRWNSEITRIQSKKGYDEANPPKISKKRAVLADILKVVALATGARLDPEELTTWTPGQYARQQTKRLLGQDDAELNQEIARQGQMANLEWLKRKPEIQQQQIQARAANQQQAALMRQLSLQGKYKRGENPTLDAQLDQAGLSVSDFDKSRGQNPIFRASNGVQYQYNRQNGQFEVAQGIPQDERAKRIPQRLSDGTIVNVTQDTALTADAARKAREETRADRVENQTYQRGRDKQSDDRYETGRREKAVTQLRTLRDIYRRAEEAANRQDQYGNLDPQGSEDAAALIREADGLASDIEGAYGDIEGVKDALRKAKSGGGVRGGAYEQK